MSSSKRQSIIMTGVGLILLSALILYFALSQPKVSDETYIESSTSMAETVTENSSYAVSEQVLETSATEYKTEETENSEVQTKSTFSGKINLNTCTASDLTALDGIGESRADAIIQYREYLGGYTSVDQIKNIKGIGDKIYEKIAPYLTV
ncbi:MAG: ComEA family DNA-binding protein [Eubacterium sp.]